MLLKLVIGVQVFLSANWYYESGSTSTELCSGFRFSFYSCSIGNGLAVDYGNGKWDFTLMLTWNGENIISGVLSQSNNNGDHVYRFYLECCVFNDVMRNRYHTITGELYYGMFNSFLIPPFSSRICSL